MTEIEIIGSSSQANGYLLKSADQILVLELGCKFMDYVEILGSDFNKVVGCTYTHKHHDHLNISTSNEFLRRGVRCYSAMNVAEESQISGISYLLSNFRNKVGQFIIQTFPAPHNVPNYGFLITTPSNERVLFLTDTTGVNLRFRDVDCVMVECNFDDDTLLDNLANNDVSMSHPEFHLGLDACKRFCKANLSSNTKQIILIHLSHANINEQHAIDTIKEYCNFDNVAVAHKGDKFIIENDDF